MTHQVPLNKQGLPKAQGLYNPENEHDACGIGFVANIKGNKSHDIIKQGLQILLNLDHRGAVGADPLAGDGAGLLIQMPDEFMQKETKKIGIDLPKLGEYGVLMVFLPHDEKVRNKIKAKFEELTAQEGQKFLGWREVPTDNSKFSDGVKKTEPYIAQGFVGMGNKCKTNADFELKLYIIRKQLSNAVVEMEDDTSFYYANSCSSRTVLYKGMLLAGQVGEYYNDLNDPDMKSALALVHQRFSTNTFPTWSLAQPFRMICHNGEINTVRGNVNWMAARRYSMESKILGDDLEKLWPLIPEGLSDTACFDNALELMVAGGYDIVHAMMMMVPEAWAGNPLMDEQRRAFYEYNAALMEPWDGPAALAFTDGFQIGATLDRNGLRPARYLVTDDDMVILASEMGVLPVPEEKIVQKWRLQPGKMLLIDTKEGRIISDEEIKANYSGAHDYQATLAKTQIKLEDLPAETAPQNTTDVPLLDRQQAFGYSQEDMKLLLPPMITSGQEALGSMGTDTPISALSDKAKPLYTYFKQNFAQVTNPPIDPIREEAVMSLVSFIGPRPNLLDLDVAGSNKRLEVRQPILLNEDLEKIRTIGDIPDNNFRTVTIDITYDAKDGAAGMEAAIERISLLAEVSVIEGDNIIILSDRNVGPDRIAIPALLATSAVHHYLIRKGLRTSVGLVVETGEAREVHHFCVLAGYGAEAINPYLVFETIDSMADELPEDMDTPTAHARYIKAVNKGILKVMSKMGISTYQSYCGAQIFDAVGLNSEFIEKYFTNTKGAVEGVGLPEVSRETAMRHADAFGDALIYRKALDVGGDYAVRLRGEAHMWTSESITSLQHAVRGNQQDDYDNFAKQINDQSERLLTPRGLFKIKTVGKAIPLEEVEPAADIVKRFATGAMSFGSISREAHTNLAIAMNRIGGKSNTGEGGEEPDRFTPDRNGDLRRSAIKQVASGRFGVTTEYLVNADDIQIKMAQGAKPGEGGQLPGHKVDPVIAKVRHSTPGVGLISPPPHHDIYSIEDLAQLIYDLKNVNPEARISVKLVSEIGVGTVAAGVSKAKADHITISGYDGGTGASPLTSIKHAGSPWEIGLAETQQTLVLNRLRDRVAVQVDGGLKTGRDVIVGALLGADEFGFATAPLIASGCIMMRKCHLNTCPVGIATQDPVLRRKFTGQPEHVINYFFFVAEEVRKLLAEMGVRSLNDIIGRSDLLDKNEAIRHWKADGLDFSNLFHKVEAEGNDDIFNSKGQEHKIYDILDRKLIEQAKDALENAKPVKIETAIKNTDRSSGAMLSGELAKRYGFKGLEDDSIHVKLSGTAGQSFGAFVAKGITLELEGEGNDYVGKGLCGGRLVVYPPEVSKIVPEESIIVGNTVLYGAITGECYFRGVAGERFAVRNSGAIAVVEGVGDHGCEYMTGGCVVVIGPTGRNFAAGMSGGIAYVLDEAGDFDRRCNMAMVDLEPVPAEDDMAKLAHQNGELEGHGRVDVLRNNMNGNDRERLVTLLENHARYTNSKRAREILDNLDEYLPKFVKVMPVEYRRALEEMASSQTSLSAYQEQGA
ncbi:glutamate synthase large subunit [Emcibacter nanhaiensis]|uniref:Glutamate synthase [NADPH] large chain n=1 Tax=Emcibacter nanhaiensis TaxID=1505037 RepID=A0A501PM65_9PROT|nr:glutamate synthase large subunit [Emcibacter nanhaiensis]TPD61523.1 glutamate synthase large subunit [Emcibacter nanhaiensis]